MYRWPGSAPRLDRDRLAQIPPQHRLPFIRDGGQVDRLVQKLFRYRQIAADAEKNGYASDPEVQLRLKLAQEQELALAWIDKVLADMRADGQRV